MALNGGLALLVDWLLFGRLRRQRSTVIILVMASFGAALTLRSLLEFIFSLKPGLLQQGPADRRCRSAAASARRLTSCCRSPSLPCLSSPCICF